MHLIGAKGIWVDDRKVVVFWIGDIHVMQLYSFLGPTNSLWRFIQGHATLAAPLQKLTNLKFPFVWKPECDRRFRGVKHALILLPFLQHPTLPNHLQSLVTHLGLALAFSYKTMSLHFTIVRDHGMLKRIAVSCSKNIGCHLHLSNLTPVLWRSFGDNTWFWSLSQLLPWDKDCPFTPTSALPLACLFWIAFIINLSMNMVGQPLPIL